MSAKFMEDREEVELKSPIRDELKAPTEEEIAACRPCRLTLIVLFSLGLIAMLVAAIVVIATTAGCAKKVYEPPLTFWQKEMAYQIYTHSFQDTDGNGYGDVKGITQRLGYLEVIGAKILVLSGMTSPTFDSLDRRSGFMADFEDLITKAKNRKISIVLDLNPTYTSNDSTWFGQSSATNSSTLRKLYIWRKAANTWTNKDGGLGWKLDKKTNFYYYYYVDEKKPVMNYNNPAVQKLFKTALKNWLDKGVKGFKLNHVQRLVVDDQFRDNLNGEIYDKDLPKTHQLLHDWHNLVKSYGGFLIGTVTEDSSVAAYYGTKEKPELDIVLSKQLTATPSSVSYGQYINQTVQNYMGSVPAKFGWPGWILDGPQYKRLTRYTRPLIVRLWNLCLLTLPGSPYFYYGDEIMLKDSLGKSTTAMAWENVKNGGFSSANPWYSPATPVTPTSNVKDQQGKKDIYAVFFEISKLRQAEASLQGRNIKILYTSSDAIIYQRYDKNEQKGFVIALNFGGTKITASTNFTSTVKGDVLIDSIYALKDRTLNLQQIGLDSYQGLVIKIK